MVWKEKGVCKGSYICFFNASEYFKNHFYYMVSCGNFHCDQDYKIADKGTRPPLFFYILSGSLEIDYMGEHFTASENDIVLLNCYRQQLYYCTEDTEFLFFHYSGKDAESLTDDLISRNGSPIFTSDAAASIYALINKPIMRLCFQDQVSEGTLSSMVYTVLCTLGQTEGIASENSSSIASISEKVIPYINQNIHKLFTLEELANTVNLSPFYFSRLFKQEVGQPPLDYVSMTKINYAKMMLRTTTASISEIGESLGYSSTSSFINAFKLRRGLSPKKYRDQINASMKDTTAAHPE